jgi:ribose transport system permease protein
MLGVLLLLAGIFSVLTLRWQPATDAVAARRLVASLAAELPAASRLLIAVRPVAAERQFAAVVEQEARTRGLEVSAVVVGPPQELRRQLAACVEANESIAAVVATERPATWLVLTEMGELFPTLGQPPIRTPSSVLWPTFLKAANILNIANQITVIAIMAIGMTLVIITGGIDLSVGSLAALAAVVVALLIRDFAGGTEAGMTGMLLASSAAIMCCGLAGAVSGGMVILFGVPPFIVTLAMMLVASGLASLLSGGESIAELPDRFVWLGRGTGIVGLPHAVLLMLLLYGAAHGLMTWTVFGRRLYAVGGNREAARLSGVPVDGVILSAYVLAGLLAGLGGVILASQLKSGSPTYGNMYELYVIAAVVVGGTSLAGGEGKMFGTLVGALVIAVIQNGMNLTNIESYTQKIVLGVVILGAVLIDRLRHRGSGG